MSRFIHTAALSDTPFLNTKNNVIKKNYEDGKDNWLSHSKFPFYEYQLRNYSSSICIIVVSFTQST